MKLPSIALAVCLSASVIAPQACTNGSPSSTTTNPTTVSQLQLQDQMRELWTAHVTLTRVFLIDAIASLPDTPQATQRLLQNQQEIGNAIRPFYGDAAATRLTVLLREHITDAAAVVAAAQSGDAARLEAANTAWYANADAIAMFLADANPRWALSDLRALMRRHLDQTLAEATARMHGDWAADVAAFDVVVTHILHMADALSTGIALQFPTMVSAAPGSTDDQDLHRTMRVLWQDHAAWTRVFIVSSIAHLPDAPAATTRLLRNQDDLGNALRRVYGNAAADRLTALLHTHITGAAEVVAAAVSDDSARLATATALWRTNADEIADFLAAANPQWNRDQLRSMMQSHLDRTAAEATARLHADWAGDVAAYDQVVKQILEMSDMLSAGISAQVASR